MTELAHEINRQVGVLVNRKGYIEHVVVGNARSIVLPDLKRVRVGEGRFRGLRCLHTHLAGEKLTQDDLTDLALLRLDLMAAVDVRSDGLPGLVHAAHMLPANESSTAPQKRKERKGSAESPPGDLSDVSVDTETEEDAASEPWGFLDPQVP